MNKNILTYSRHYKIHTHIRYVCVSYSTYKKLYI